MPGMRSSAARTWFLVAPVVAAATAALQCAPATAQVQLYPPNKVVRVQTAPPRPYPQIQAPPKVFLLRGFLNVFSLGMDDIASKLQADGIRAMVTNHADEDLIARRIVADYNAGDRAPIVLIGHSLGADAIVDVAGALSRYNVPVALLVLFDSTAPHEIPPNVVSAINYTKHFTIAPAPGARGVVSNVDLSADPGVDHLNIDVMPSLQAQTVHSVLQVASAAPGEPAQRRQ
jgi:hypothetical protein